MPEIIENVSQAPKAKRTHVWFEKNDSPFHIWYCPTCTKPLFKIQGMAATVVPGDPEAKEFKMMKFPLVVLCRGKHIRYGKCPAEYVIEGFAQ